MQVLRNISNKASLLLFLLVLLCSSCYHQNTKNINENLLDSVGQNDSSHFKATHHYSSNYNFVVKADSLVLSKQQPEETLSHLQEDSLIVYKNDHLVVADIRIMSADSIDSVWVQVARDQQTFGWIHESKLLPNVVPDDPISLFISTFSDIHLLVFLVIIVLISVYYIMRKLLSASLPIVHLRDINSIYPTLLVLLVATSATFYASIQLFCSSGLASFLLPSNAQSIFSTIAFKPLLAIGLGHIINWFGCNRRCSPSSTLRRCGVVSMRFGSSMCC